MRNLGLVSCIIGILTAFSVLRVCNSCDAPTNITDATYSPVQANYADGETVTYACNTGYEHSSGNLSLICNNSTELWEGTPLVCTLVTCAAPASVPNSSRAPDQASYDYNTDITYTCNTGYDHTSGNLIRTCSASGTWSGTAPVCTIVTCAAPAIVPNSTRAPDQGSYDYNTDITYTCDTGYDHSSGNLTRTCTASGTWTGTAPVCAIVTCAAPASVSNSTRAPDQASYDYNTDITYTCDTGYDHTSGNLTRTCTAIDTWSGTAPVCTIVTCAAPASVPNSTRAPDQASYDYNTDTTYTCDTGYENTSGNLTRTCTASGTWSGTAPVCTIVTCSEPASVPNASRTPDQALYDYNTDISYACDTGYEHTGGNLTRTCMDSGAWSGTAPVCTIITCAAPLSVPNSSRTPDQAVYDYNTDISYICDTGYEHAGGDLNRTCTASGAWSGTAPVCAIVTCAAPASVPNSTRAPDQASYDYNTGITYTCDTGYEHTMGNLVRTCEANSTWSGTAPVCTTITCAEAIIPNASKSPDLSSYAFNDTVTYICDTGYNHTNGDLERICTAIDTWSGTAPICSIVTCAAVTVADSLRSPNQAAYDYATNVTYSCNEGYEHSGGDLTRLCTADGTWSGTEPVCTIVTCAGEDFPHATRTPNQTDYDYNTNVVYSCEVGFELTAGDLTRTCAADRTWSGTAPTCSLVTCAEVVVPNSSKTPDLSTYNYTDVVEYACDTGFELTSGILMRMCTASGTWTGAAPVCNIKTCASVSVDHATASPDQTTYNYNTDVTYICDLAYNHTGGDLTRTCNASAEWTGILPTCTVVACIEENGVSCSFTPTSLTTLHDFGDVVTYMCDIGYNHSTGDLVRTCQNTGEWTGTAPVCTIVTCDHPPVVENTTQASPTIQAEYDYLTDITYECVLAYNHSAGDFVRTCQANASWSGEPPVCLVAACIQEGADNSTFSPVSPTTLHKFGDVLTYTCNEGYKYSTGDLVRTCQNNGEWSGVLPTCPIVKCSQPPIPIFTSISPVQTEYIYLSVVTYTCDLGYNRTAGDETRYCDENAQWIGVEAVCTLVTCEPPPAPHMSYSQDLPLYNYSDSVNFTCDLGYYYGSGDMTRSCNEHAQWTGSPTVCSIVQCPQIIEPHAAMLPNQAFYDYNTSVTYTCDIGYNMTDGDAERWCNYTGTWADSPPVCTIVECDPPDPVTYASWGPINSPYVYQDTLTYTCNLGYEITTGDATRTCGPDGWWTNTAPNCTIIHCPVPANGTFTTYTPDLADFIWNDTVDYTCIFGYNHSSGDLHRECQHDKTWSGTTPVCIIITCDKVDIDHMTFSPPTSDTHDFGTTIIYTCDIGYNHSYGDLEHTCTHTREWTGVFPNCTIVECDSPDPVTYASWGPINSPYVYQNTLTYTCNLGYEITNGDATRTCGPDGWWTNIAPNCTIIHCPVPTNGTFTTYTPDLADYIWNDTVDYTCNFGYNHSSGDLHRECQHDKTWSGTTPVCIIITCDRVDIDHMTFSPPTSDTHDYGTTIIYTCDIGYNHSYGDLEHTCTHTREWSGVFPNCTIVECDPPDPVTFASWGPINSRYVYQDTLTYTCNLGYEITTGNNTRTCGPDGWWTNIAPNCTIIHCPVPANGTFTTYSPDLADYIWNDTVDYTCIFGYNHSSGDLHRECQHDKTWSGTTPVCIIITCDKVDIDHMTFSPPTSDTHVFGTTITYTCDIGYNHSYGDLEHTCTHTREWSGVFPNCTIITCDPPAPIAHTVYTPSLPEHDWNTAIQYSCDVDYHYVNGVDTTTCNETGEFPPVDFDCSVQHTLAKDPNEPDVTIINTTVTTANILFNYDGMCNVAVQVVPNSLDVTLTSSGTVITITVSERGNTKWDIYSVQLLPTKLDRSWPMVSAPVFYGLQIQGFQAWLDNSIAYIEIGKEYTFRVTVSQATDVTLTWILESTVNITEVQSGLFSSASIAHTYNVAGLHEVSVYLSNFVSSDSEMFTVYVLYNLNEVSFSVDFTLTDTITPVVFNFTLSSACQFPMGDVEFHIDYKHGSNDSFLEHLNNSVSPLPYHYSKTHLFDTQGVYNVHAKAEHILGSKEFDITVNVWDSLDSLNLEIQGQANNIYVTNTTTVLEFTGYLYAGFQYSIDFGDGTSNASSGTDIMYSPYALSAFVHVYDQPDVYFVSWMSWNGHYNRADSFSIIVQNVVQNFQAWLNNDISYIEVGQSYTFEANATQGTDMTVAWSFEATVNITEFIVGEFLSETYDHAFGGPGRYDITISVVNLVSSASETFTIHALYSLDCLSFSVDSSLANTTQDAVFSFNLSISCSFPMGNVDFHIDFNHSMPLSFMESLNTSLPLPYSIEKSHLFGTQGIYEIYATAENILGKRSFSLTLEVWDTLIPLKLETKNNSKGNVYVTNTMTSLEFVDVPNAGFEFSIDFGDGTNHSYVSSNGTDILYEPYSLNTFDHTYTQPMVYTVTWMAKNGYSAYDRLETFSIIVQNEVQDFKAWLNNAKAYIEVDQVYTFEANGTCGTNMAISWSLEPTVNTTSFIVGEFTSATLDHSFSSPGSYEIVVSVANLVSSASETFTIYALYSLDCLSFSVDSDLANTTLAAIFSFDLPSTCKFPMGDVDFYINFNHSVPVSFMDSLNTSRPLPHSIERSHLFDTQGVYEVYSTAENILGEKQFSLTVKVWDTLLPLRLEIKNNSRGNIFATNTTVSLEFMDVPNAGFEYVINYGDGRNHSSNSSDILYKDFSLTTFEHVYIEPEVYTVIWTAENGHDPYDRQDSFAIIVQNKVTDFKAWLNNAKAYIEVDQVYTFEANGTCGTNMTISWSLEPTVNTTSFIVGEFTSGTLDHSFSGPGSYDIVVSVANLVSSASETFTIYALYSLDCLSFSVDSDLANTTLVAIFSFDLPSTCKFPMGDVDFYINFNHSAPVSFLDSLNTSHTLPHSIERSHLFDTQGVYEVYSTAENILGEKQFSLTVRVWDTLLPLRLEIKNNSRGNIFATNTTVSLEFLDVPNAGFEYAINYGDGENHSSNSSDVLYKDYSLTIFEHVYREPEVYTVIWTAENGHDPYDRQDSFAIIVQNKVTDFKAWLNNAKAYIEVEQVYTFEANGTCGTNMTISWSLEPTVNTTSFIVGEFTSATLDHSFSSPGSYDIVVSVANLVSSASETFTIYALYSLDCLSFSVDSDLANTTLAAIFSFDLPSTCKFPMGDVDFYINFNHSVPVSFMDSLNTSRPLPHSIESSHLFDTQGVYEVYSSAENILGEKQFSLTVRVWDTLLPLRLEIKNNSRGNIFATNTTVSLEFMDVPNAGFEYVINYGDGRNHSSNSSDILYKDFSLTTFEHVYIEPEVYTVIWTAENGHDPYDRQDSFAIIVQNKVTDFKAWLNNSIMYLAVGDEYLFEASGTQGTNVSVAWNFEPGVTLNDTFPGEYTYSQKRYTYNTPGEYNISVIASNLVSLQTDFIFVIVIYRLNGLTFNVDKMLGNTTHNCLFDYTFNSGTNLPMDSVSFHINYKYGNNISETHLLGPSETLPYILNYQHLFDIQGIYLVEGTAENILGSLNFTINMSIWDTLDPLEFNFYLSNGKYITNTTTTLVFENIPNAGFEYEIDYGDGSTGDRSSGPEILYRLYNLTEFNHTYTMAGIYTIHWIAYNGHYRRDETFTVLIQNRVPTEGYTLEPVGLKYPWINLQTMDIPLNITLNNTVPLPTNATCVFQPDDGKPQVTDLVYNESFFQHTHRYLFEGTFNSTLNCSNEVSWYVYTFNLCVQKYNASFLAVVFEHLVPLNVSDNVTVYFHIDNGGFALIPFQVYLDWDYGDGSFSRRRRSPVPYDVPVYTHVYSARGDYKVVIIVTADVTNTSNDLEYDLRLGIMHFEYNYVIGFINTTEIVYTMYGVLGVDTTYTLDFADSTPDGVCNSIDYSGCIVKHIFPYWGQRTVQAVASNGTFVEIDEVFMTIDNPIVNLTLDIVRSVAIPDGVVAVNLRIEDLSPVLPFLKCIVSMGDPINRALITDTQNVTYSTPFYFSFQYIALGRWKIEAHCWNLINETDLWTEIVVTNKDFLFTGTFDRQFSQRETPLRLSSMKDNEITNRLYVLAPLEEKTRINLWTVENITGPFPERHSIIFPRGYMKDGTYLVVLTVGFVEDPLNKVPEPTYCDFISPPPHAEIVGGRRRVSSSGDITVDAVILSYDPVFTESSALTFLWDCKSYTGSSFADVIAAHEGGTSSSQNCLTSPVSDGVMSLTTVTGRWYAVTVTVENNRTLTSSYTQYIRIKATIALSIICRMNCLSKVAVTSKLQLVPQLSNNCKATFTWRLQKKIGTDYGSYISLASITETGNNKPSLTIKANSLDPGSWYLITLEMSKDGSLYGPAYYEFVTNKPPKGGSCRVVPYDEYKIPLPTELVNSSVIPATIYSSVANKQEYNLTCKDWLDEGFTEDTWTEDEPLYYYFFLQYGNDDDQRQILYFDPGATSNLVTFQMGDIDDGYQATVVLRIADVFGDYTEIRYSVISTPYLTTEQLLPMTDRVQAQTVEANISVFDEELLKANQSYDYRTLARKIQGISSVYNAVVLNTSTTITLTPDDLLTLGYKRTEDGKLIKWADYWSLIVEVVDTSTQDYLIHTGEKYVNMLHHSITTWPSDRRMSIVAIETMGRALNATLAKVDYSNVTAAIRASECAKVLAQHLGSHVDDRTFPNTEEMYYASIALRDLIRNILATLQTVLTPNLPVDPTVEEMRNYLLYIQVFKSEVEGTAPLSLQEQTFLAQKQLQKYYVAKHIKSEASKIALPFVQSALTYMTDMFSKMIQIGQAEMYMENDFIYISAEVSPAYELFGTTVERPHAAIVLDSLMETHPEACNGSAVTVKTTIFKHNPYFWGEWADRISSYVPRFDFNKAILVGDTIRFKLENAVTPDCIDKTPTYFEDDPNKMIYILFDRMYGDDDILLFIRPNATELVYQAYFNKDEKPSVEDRQYIYSTEINVDKWTYEDGYKVKINANEFSTTGKIWIALRPLLENSVDLSLLTRPFCANVTSVNCLAWVKDSAGNDYWDKDLCKVSRDTSRKETVCDCENPGPGKSLTVGTTFYVPPNKIDFFAVFEDTDPLGNASVLGTLIAVLVVFVLFVPWAWRADLKDKYKWSYALLVDNDIADSYFYLLRVYTGIRHGSGTKSNVGFVLVGDDGDTGIRIMDDDSHVGFEAGSVRNFVLSTRQRLGDVVCLRIWHDDSGGNESAWFLNKILVTDLQTGKKYIFKCNQWLDYDHGDQKVDRALTAQTADESRTVYEMAPYTAAENHLWLSVFLRPLNSNFTRVQRLGCLLGLLYLTMIICTLILKTPDDTDGMTEVVIGPFRFSMQNFLTALISVAVISPLIMIVAFLFKNAESEGDDNEYISCCRKGYKKVNDVVKVDKSVLGTEYVPPTRVVVKHFHFLPHFCVYVAWVLIVLCVGMATWLLMLFSADWKLQKSEIWMTTIFCALLLSIFVVETIKTGILIAVIALLCNKAYDPPEPYIDTDRLKEISKKNSHFLTKGPFYMNFLHKPPLPSAETLEENHRRRISNHQILKIFYQLLAFGGVLYIVYMISFENRDPQSYTFKKHVQNMMGFDSVKDVDTYIHWLNGTFVEEFFFSKYFGSEYSDGTYKSFARDIANLRVGPARLRQLRIRKDHCQGPLGDYLGSCYDRYADSRVETSDYCIGWKDMPCAVSEKADYFTSAAWLYNSSAEVWGFPTMAEYNNYMGGGYFMKLDVNKDVSLRIFSELLNQGWIDRATRVVILEFTLYNVNSNLFSYAKFVAEFPEVGGVLPYTDIQIFRLYTNSSTILFLQFIFVLLVLAGTVYMLYEICSNGGIYFKRIWNWLDILALVMSYSTVAIFIVKLNILEKTINVFHEDKNAYVSFENLAFYDFFANTTLGILVFLLSVRVSRILGYSGKINEMAAVITTSADDLAGFCVIFGVTYFAYVQMGWMLFGKGTRKYRDMFHTYGTLTEAIVGKNRLGVIMTAEPMLAEFYYFTFVLFVLLTLATMAAAILNFSITHVKQESKQISAPNIIEVIFDKIGAFITKLTEDGTKDGKGTKKAVRRKSSTSELRDILADFKHFLRDVSLQSKEKYRVLTPDPK